MLTRKLLILLLLIGISLQLTLPGRAEPQAVITVNNLADDLTIDGTCTLRKALRAAALNVAWDGCAAGNPSGSDLIVFSVDGTIEMALGEYVISSPVIIRGNGPSLTILDAGGTSNVMTVEDAALGLESLSMQNGDTLHGGAIHAPFLDGPLREINLDNVVIQDSYALNGGGIHATKRVITVKNSMLQRNSSNFGAAIFVGQSEMILEDSTVQGNANIGIYALNTYVTVLRTLIQGNLSSEGSGGGGIFFQNGTLTIIDSTIRNNVADQGGNGGGILATAGIVNVEIQGSTISGNSAEQGSGGGIYFSDNFSGDELLLTNSTISGNTALLGGGVFINSDVMNQSPTIRYTTIVNNTALSVIGAGGAVFLDPDSSPLAFSRNIVHDNTGSPTCYPAGGWLSGGFNLLQDTSCGNHVTDLVGVDPQLGALEDNGGATQTHALLANSPAIDAAVCLGTITTDQRGAARPQGASCDSGSYEFGGTLAVVYLPVVLRNP